MKVSKAYHHPDSMVFAGCVYKFLYGYVSSICVHYAYRLEWTQTTYFFSTLFFLLQY